VTAAVLRQRGSLRRRAWTAHQLQRIAPLDLGVGFSIVNVHFRACDSKSRIPPFGDRRRSTSICLLLASRERAPSVGYDRCDCMFRPAPVLRRSVA
jgi:hypothetical protein